MLLKLTINDIEISNSYLLDKVSFKMQSTLRDFGVGDFLFNIVTLKLHNDVSIAYGDIVKITIDDIPYGTYEPYEITQKDLYRDVQLYAMPVISLMKEYQPLFATSTYTTRSLLIEMATELNITIHDLANIPTVDMGVITPDTGMNILSQIATVMAQNVFINHNGEIEFKLLGNTHSINQSNITSVTKGESEYLITQITGKKDSSDKEPIVVGIFANEWNTMTIQNAYLTTSVCNNILGVLSQIKYYGFKLKIFNFSPNIKILDQLKFTYRGIQYTMPIMNLTLSFSVGGLVAEVESLVSNNNNGKANQFKGSFSSKLDVITNLTSELNTKFEVIDGQVSSVITQTDVLTNRINSLEAGKTYSVILSNEYQNIPVNANNMPVENKTYSTTVQVFDGATPVAFTIGTISNANGITVTKSSNTVSFTVSSATALNGNSGNFDIPIILEDSQTIIKTFSWSATKDGSDGSSAKMLTLSTTSHVMHSSDGGKTYTPSQLTVTATCQNVTPNKWYVSVDGGLTFGEKTDKRGSSSYTFNLNSFTSNKTNVLVVKCESTDTNVFDTITLNLIEDGVDGESGVSGEDAYTIVLTNESQTIPTNINRVPTSNATYYTDIIVYKGSTQRTDYTIGTVSSSKGITVSKTTSRVNFAVSTSTTITADSGSFTIPITIDGKTFNKTFSFSCSKQGAAGSNAKTLDLTANSTVMRSNDGGKTFSPDSIVVTATCQNTTPNKWYVSVDGGATFGEKTSNQGYSTYTIYLNSFTSTDTLVVKCVSQDANVYDVITLQRLVDVVDIQDDIQAIVDRQSSFEQDLDGITSRVSKAETNINNTNNNIVNNYYTKTETNTQIEQTATQISQTVASQQIGKITVGARNYILKSNVETTVASLTTTDHKFYNWNLSLETPYINQANKGDTQMFTLQVWFSGNASNPFTRIKIGENTVHQIMFSDCTVTQVDTDMYKAIGRFTVNKDNILGNDYTITIVCNGASGCSSTIKYLQLEEGNIASSYQQPLEDVVSDFDAKIDETIENIVNGNQEIQSLVQSIISDDYISDSERADLVLIFKEITAQYNNITQEVADYGNENKNYFSTFTNALTSSYNAFSNALNKVLNNNADSGKVALQELLATYYDAYHKLLYVISQFVKSERERLQTEIIQTNSSISNVITRVDNEVNERKKFMRFSESGLELFTTINGQVGAFKVLLSENRLSFYENGGEVAYMSNNKLFISNAEITTSLQIGNVVGRKSSNEGFVFNKAK